MHSMGSPYLSMRESILLPNIQGREIKNKIQFSTLLPLGKNTKVKNSKKVGVASGLHFQSLNIFPNI